MKVRILYARVNRVRVPPFEVPDNDIDIDDSTGWALVLTREVNRRNLGDPDDFRIQVRHPRRGWVEHRRPG